MPTLDALAARDGELQVLVVSQDLDGREKVEAFFEHGQFSMLESYLDPQMALMMGLRVDTLPTTILYDAQGREIWRMTGQADLTGESTAVQNRQALTPAVVLGTANTCTPRGPARS